MRKYDGIDLVKLRTQTTHEQWNRFLTRCEKRNDVESLKRVFYGIQIGMDDLVRKGLNTDHVNMWFIRLQRSIENTFKRINRKLNPSPLDNPLNAGNYGKKELEEKRTRDRQFEMDLKRMRF